MRLRRALDGGASCPLATRRGGYEMVLDDGDLDANLFEGLVVAGRRTMAEGREAAAFAQLSEGLALWRGPALADVPTSPTVMAQAIRLNQIRLTALEERLDTQLRLGRHDDVVDELHVMVAEHPLRERLRAHLMLALYRCGRRAEALAAYRRARQDLVELVGVEPGPPLRQLHRAILADEPRLAAAPAGGAHAGRVVPAQLPPDPPGFVGRDSQLARLDSLRAGVAQRGVGIVAITGTAGVGKTALAVHWAHRVRPTFPDGQLHVDLRGYAGSSPMRPIDVLSRFLLALGVPADEVPAELEPAGALFRSVLTGRRVLVVLDNASHPEQVRPLLPGSPGCLVLITSRDRLVGLVARDGAVGLTVDALTPVEARTLLTGLEPTKLIEADPQAVTELAELCDRLPLALRIAAARLTAGRMTVAALCAQLRRDRLAGLEVEGDPDAAVRVALDQSYATLPFDARRLFRLLGAVPGPDITATAAAALAGVADSAAARLLDQLTGVHLVDEHAPGRYALHDLVRAYACARADTDGGEVPAGLDRLYAFYWRAVNEAAELLYPQILRLPAPPDVAAPAITFDDHAHARSWLDAERANMVAAVRQAAEHGSYVHAWQLADALRGYLYQRRFTVDWSTVAEAGLAAANADGCPSAQAAAHLSLAVLHWVRGRHGPAITHYASARTSARQAQWAEGESAALGNLGTVYRTIGRLTEATAHITAALAIDQRVGWRAGQASKLANLGAVYRDQGRLTDSAQHYRQALALYGTATSHAGIVLCNLGDVYHLLGQYDDALTTLTSALELTRGVGNWHYEADATCMLAALHLDTGQRAEAIRLTRVALAYARDNKNRQVEASALIVAATVYRDRRRSRRAVTASRRAVRIARDIGDRYIEAQALIALAAAHRLARSPARGVSPAGAALAIARQSGFRVLEGQALTVIAEIELDRGRPAQSLRIAHAALAAHETTGHRSGQARAERALTGARQRLNA